MSRYERLKNEIVAGGSVTDVPAEIIDEDPRPPVWQSVIGMAGILALFAWLLAINPWMFVFAVGILVSVFLHETGHFVTARATGMKATQFFIGFGPRLWSFERGETEYGVRLLPLGAFVRIIGMHNIDEVPPGDEARTYRQKSYPRRMLVITAGSLMHILIAIVLFFSVFATRGQLEAYDGARVADLTADGPAARAGLEEDDVITAVDSVAVDDPAALGETVRSHQPGDVVDLTVVRGGEQLTVPVTLGANPSEGELAGAAYVGVASGTPTRWEEMSVTEAATSSVTELGPITWESAKGVAKVLNPVNIVNHMTGETEDLDTRPTTVVGITQASGSIGDDEGFVGVIYLLAALNVFVGVFNMLPLLPLDGGHAAIATYERVRERGRRGARYFADVSKMMPVALAVIMLLLFLFMSGLYLDVTKPLG
jgi:membrane-associated protease RseP (regulator of RpoE activity)